MSRGPPNVTRMFSLKVDNLPYRTNPETLRTTFERYGEVGDVYIPRDKNYESRGFAFVRYYERRDAEDAIDALDGEVLEGRELRVQMAKYGRPANERRGPPRRYGGGGRGRYGRSYSRSRSRSPDRRRRQRSNSRSRSRSRSPNYRRRSPSKSASPQRPASRSPSRSRSRSKS